MPVMEGDHHDYPPNRPCWRARVGVHWPGTRARGGLKPLQGEVIDLGDVSGVAYYTVERDGFRVVATLAKKDEDAVPVRVVVVLAPGQSLTLSTPHEAGTPPDEVKIFRRVDTVLVKAPAARADTVLVLW